jgi:hypothetical protein
MVELRQHIKLRDVRAVWTSKPSAEGGGSTVGMSTCMLERGRWRCWHESHRQRWWALDLFVRLLTNAGFRLLGVHRLPDYAPVGVADRWVQMVARR